MSLSNQDYIIAKGYLKKFAHTAEKLNKSQKEQQISLLIMKNLFEHSNETSSKYFFFIV